MPRRTLTPKQILVLSALMSGLTNDEAARKAGVSGATVERYKADPAFQENMAVVLSESLQLVSERLVSLSIIAMTKLEDIITNEDTRTIDRLKAIEVVFSRLETFNSVVRRQQRSDEEELRRLQLQRLRHRGDDGRESLG